MLSSSIHTYRVVLSAWVLTIIPLTLFPQSQELDVNALKERAWAIVENLGPQVQQFADYRDQVVVSLKLADLLWERNEQLSRDTFVAALRAIPPSTTETPKDELRFRQQLRLRVLTALARWDPKLAEKLTRELTKPQTDDPSKSLELTDSERTARAELLMQQAALLARSDLKGAASLVEAALRYKVVPFFPDVLELFAEKDPETAARLYNVAFARARAQQFSDNALETMLKATLQTRGITPPVYTPAQVRELLTVLGREVSEGHYQPGTQTIRMASEEVQVPTIIPVLNQLIPLYEQYLPDQLPEIQSYLSSQMRSLSELQAVALQFTSPSGIDFLTMDELLSKAEKARSFRARDVWYELAVKRALRDGDFPRALSIAEKIQDVPRREGEIFSVQMSLAVAAVLDGDTDKALGLVRKTSKDKCGFTVAIYYEAAKRLAKQGSREQALATITEAQQCWSSRQAVADPVVAASSLTLLADALVSIDEQSCFLLSSSIVEWINRCTERKDKKRPQEGFEWATLPIHGYGLSAGRKGISGFADFENILAQLGQRDFDRTILIVTGIKPPALRAIAQLAACSGIIHKKTEKAAPSSGN